SRLEPEQVTRPCGRSRGLRPEPVVVPRSVCGDDDPRTKGAGVAGRYHALIRSAAAAELARGIRLKDTGAHRCGPLAEHRIEMLAAERVSPPINVGAKVRHLRHNCFAAREDRDASHFRSGNLEETLAQPK